MRKWIVQAVVPILGGLALLLGVIALGRGARAALHDRAEYTIAFRDIACEPPEGMLPGAFLGEVRHLARQPETLHLLDEDLASRLARAFAFHPWVETVRGVQIHKGPSVIGKARATVSIELTYRQPVLAVCLPGEEMAARTVDRQGVLLPVSAAYTNLPVLTASVSAPVGATGSQWGDRRVCLAAATAAFLKPHLARLHLEGCDIEVVREEVVFRKPGVRVVWGHAPGHEEASEAPATVKLQRLLDYQASHDGLGSLEHDVRLLAYQGHFPLSLEAQP